MYATKDTLVTTVFKSYLITLTGMAWLVECPSTKQKVAGSIPGQGTCLGLCPVSWLGPV